jgi:hypothetical protein
MAEPTSYWREFGEAIVLVLGGVGGALGWKARKQRVEPNRELDRWRQHVDEWREDTDNQLESLRTNQAVAKAGFEFMQSDVLETKASVKSIEANVLLILQRLPK